MDGENNLLVDKMGDLRLPGAGSVAADAAKAGAMLASSEMGELQLPDLTRAAQRATVSVPKNADEYDYRVRAKTISEAMGRAIAIAKRETGDGADTDEVKDAKARAHADAIAVLLTGKHDYNGAMWTPDRKGFASGAAYFQHMRNLVLNGPAASLTEDYKRFMEADYDEQCRIAAEHEEAWDMAVRAGGDAASWLWNLGTVETLPQAEERRAPEEVRKANATLFVRDIGGTKLDPEKLKAAEEVVGKYRDERRREEIRAKYEAKLNRENAWNALTTILPALSEDAQKCARALVESEDNALPPGYWARFNALPERDRELIVQVRSMMKPETEGGFWNTLGDMGVGAANITLNIASAPVRQAAKAINMSRNSAYDAGIDVNNLARRRHLLWQASGNFLAGGDIRGLQLPQLQFENFCEEHGFVGNALIGAVSTLPYMAAAAVPYAGTALVALEAMQEFDDHVVMNGGDITDGRYIASSALLGGLYAYIEKLQLEGLLGGVSDQKLREATLKGLFKGAEARLAVGRTVFAGALSESLQEGLQNGIMAVNEALALKGDVVRAFGEGFTEDFIGSLGTMFVIEAGGVVAGHMGRSGFRFGREGMENRSRDLTTLLSSQFARQSMVDQSARSAEWHTQAETRRYASLYGFWRDGGAAALIEKGGASREEADRLDALFSELRATEGAMASGEAAEAEWTKGGGDMADVEALLARLQNGDIERDMFVDALHVIGFSERGAADFAAMLDANASIAEKYEAWAARFQVEMSERGATEEGRAEDFARVSRSIEDLSWARGVWSKGAGVIAVSRGADGSAKVEDPGAAALQAAGFAENDARTLSRLFHEERAMAHSPATLDGVRALYDAATRGRLGATAALERDFGGRMVRLEVGKDEKGSPIYGSFIRFSRFHMEERTAEDGTKTKFRVEDPDGLVRIVETDLPAVDHTNTSDEVAASVEEATKGLKTPITREQWKGATDAQRRKWVEDYRLQDEGGFVLYAPEDPSVKINASDAGQIVGEIRIGANTNFIKGGKGGIIGTSSVFHEIFHAWARFMYQSGIWTDKDVARLRERFGKPRTAGELFNEEAAANEFRAYAARRMSGAASEADEGDGIFRKLWRLARGVKARADEKAVQSEVAKTTGEAFFDQIIADLYKDIPDFKADEKPKVEKPKGGEAPNMPGKEKAAETKRGESETKPGETETKPGKPETESGKSETKSGKSETGTPQPTRAGAAATGWSAATPTGNVRVTGHWAVFDLSELIHSNNPLYAKYMRNQLRNRKSNKAEEDARENIINNFDAARLFEAPDTANGAPIVFMDVDDEGKLHPYVLSGNGRVLVLNALAERHLYDKYRNYMKSWAAENGLDVGNGENKVVVRVIDDYGGATREQVADLSNTNSIQQYTEEEQARADAETIKTLGLARLYRSNADGSPDMTPGANDEFFMRFIQATGDTALYNADRTITETARNRVQRALLAIAVGQGDRGRDVVKKLVDRSDTLGINRQKNALAVMAADVAALESSADYAIGPDVSRAVADFIDFTENRDSGKKWGTIENYLSQQDLLDAPSEVAKDILAILGSRQSAADMAEYVRQYCDAATKEDPTGGLFGAEAARTRLDIWRDARRTVDERREKNAAAEKELAAKRHSVISAEDYFTGSNRAIAHGLKDGDGIAIRLAARRMAAMLPENAAIVPMPSSRGDAGATLLLARQIARFSGRPVVEALAGRPRESLYAAKKKGGLPGAETLGFRKVRDIPKGLQAWIVDNVYSTGTTARAAQLALEGAHVLAFADASEEAFDIFGTPRLRNSVSAVVSPEEDAAYADAVKRGDKEAYTRMLREVAARRGWSDDASWRMDHRAPNSQDVGDGVARVSDIDMKDGGLVPADYWTNPEWYIDMSSPEEVESYYAIRNALYEEARHREAGDGKHAIVQMYRGVDKKKNAREGKFRNGDWCTPSLAYARREAADNQNGGRVIAMRVGIDKLYWSADSIAEFGYDDGKSYAYKDTKNNRKLLEPTYSGDELIPLSQRFNAREFSVRWSFAAAQSEAQAVLDRIGGTELGNFINREFKERSKTNLIGKRVSSAHDLAALAQIYRNPCFETFRYFFTKDGSIVWQTGVTARLPGVSSVSVATPKENTYAEIERMAKKLKPDGVWLLHNHPSGDILPSPQDRTTTRELGRYFDSLGVSLEAHVVIDHDKYAWMGKDGEPRGRGVKTASLDASFHGDPYVRRIRKPGEPFTIGLIAELAMNIQRDATQPGKMLTLISVDSKGSFVTSIANIPAESVATGAEDFFADWRGATGAAHLVVVGDMDVDEYPAKVRRALLRQIESGNMTDFLFSDRAGAWDSVMHRGGVRPQPSKQNDLATRRMTTVDDGQARFSFAIGEVGAANLDDALFAAGNLSAAREMLAGRDWATLKKAEKLRIKTATGWEKGADGKWRLEKDDFPAIIFNRLKKPNPDYKEGETAKYMPVKLSDIFAKKLWRNIPLFEAYPWLKDVTVQYGAAGMGTANGSLYDSEDGKFVISISDERRPDEAGVRTTLIHELQHVIQRVEGFARGGNMRLVEKLFLKKFDDAREEARNWNRHFYAIIHKYDTITGLRYLNYPRKHPYHILAAEQIESDPEWPKLEDDRRAFRKKWGHDPKFFVDSDWGAMSKAVRSSFRDYQKLAGEVEARNASQRTSADMVKLLEETEDVARKSQILLGAGAQLMQRVVDAENVRARRSFASLRAGSFAGVKSIDDAEVMESRGDDRETIFRLTGWWRAADRKWRVELPFHGRFSYKGEFKGERSSGFLDNYWDWPELFELYPELRSVAVSFMPDAEMGGASAAYYSASDGTPDQMDIAASHRDAPDLPAIFIHEIQHAIQDIEDLARGGNPADFMNYDASDRRSIRDMAAHYKALLDEAISSKADKDEVSALRSQFDYYQSQIDEFEQDSTAAQRQYDHLAGEVEARNAAERFFMSPEERLERPPWTTQDWSDESQIVRFGERYSLAALRGAPKLDTYMDVNEFAHGLVFTGSAEDALPEHRFEHRPDFDRYCHLDYTPSFWVVCLNRQMKPIANPIPVHKGAMVMSLPHPRETFERPLRWGVKDIAVIVTEPIAGFGNSYPLKKQTEDYEKILESGRIVGVNVRSWTIMRSDGRARPYGSADFEDVAPFRDPPLDAVRREVNRQLYGFRYSVVSDAEVDAYLRDHGYDESERDLVRSVLIGEKHKQEQLAKFNALPLQERYPLVAAHGMSQIALQKALKSGTLLMPSIGISQAGTGWTQAGYTDGDNRRSKAFVMFAKESLVGPDGDIYTNDAFTPTINDLIEAGVVTSEGDIPDAPSLDEKIAALREAFNKDIRGLERITNLDEEALRKQLYELPDWDDADIAGMMGERQMLEAKLWRRVPITEAKAVILAGMNPDLAAALREKGVKVVELPDGAKPYEIANAQRDMRFSVHAWEPDFPQVLTVTNPDTLINRNAELHKAAKAGSIQAALRLVDAVVGPATVGAKGKPSPKFEKIRALCAAHPTARVVPVIALEATGHNMLPYAYARRFAEIGGIKFDDRIRQTVKANHTGANAVERMAARAEFSGPIKAGAEYIILDDVVTQGGTLNELRKYIQSKGGKVVAATTLTSARFSATLRISETKIQQLHAKFGEIDELLQEAGIANGTAELTESEARELLKCSPDTLRSRLAEQSRRRSEGVLHQGRDESEDALRRLTQGELRLSVSAAALDELPGLLGYFDSQGRMYSTRFAKAKEFNRPISVQLNSLLDELLASDRSVARLFAEQPEADAEKTLEGWLKGYIEDACRSEEIGSCHRKMMEGYPKESYKAGDAEKNRIVAEMTADRITVSINDALKAKNARLIERVNALRPELPPIAADGTGSYVPSRDRICHIVIGPPAAGKSEVFANRLSLYHRARIVDCDIAKSRLKHFDGGFGANYVHEASSEIWDGVFTASLERGENIVVPIVGAKEKSVVARVAACHRAGYMVYLHLNELPILQAYARSLIRCLNTGRYINPQVLIDCGERPTAVYKRLVERKKKEIENATRTGELDRGGSGGTRDAGEIAYGRAAASGRDAAQPGQGGLDARSGRMPERDVGLPDHFDHFSNNVPQGFSPTRIGGDYREPAYPYTERRPQPERGPASIGGQYILPGFEQIARRAVSASILDGESDAQEKALVNYVAYFRLANGPKPSARTIARLGLSVGMNVVSAGRIYKKADELAERMRGTIVEKAAANGDAATAIALMKREDDIDGAVERLISGGAAAGGQLTHSGVGQINSLLKKRVEQMMRDFTAASLADMEGETGLDLAAEILANDPNAFADELKKARGADPEAPQPSDDDGGADDEGDENLTDYQRFQRDQARKEALAKVEKFIADAKARAAERRARAEERRKRAEEQESQGDGEGGGDAFGEAGASFARDDNAPKNTVAGFKTKEEFAAFMRVWAADRFQREHGHSTLAKAEQDRLFAEFYRITVRKELSDLADKLLAPRGARAHVNRRLQELEKGVRPDTIERISASVFAFINAAAIRESRVELVKAFKKEIKETYAKGKFYEDLKLDSDRRVTGWVEEAARYICHVCDLSTREINGSPSQLEEERRKIQEIIDRREKVYEDSGKEIASAHKEDMETKRAYAKMALLEKYGAMTSLMPGQILDLQHEAHEYLKAKAVELDNIWRDTRAYEDDIRKKLAGAIQGPNGGRYEEKGWLNGRLFDALNGLLRLRLQHLTRFASDKARAEAKDAINNIIVMLGDGETAYARALQDDRAAFFTGLAQLFQKPGGGADNAAIKKYLERMTEKIPPELARQLSMQGYAETMTYGQMLQLLVSLEQHSYDNAIRENGREGQAELIRSFETTDEKGRRVRVMSEADVRFIEWIRAFYAAKREVLSPIMMRMVGQEVDSPDPLYAPVRMSMDDRARGLHTDSAQRWDPISAVMTRRVATTRDFDESASIVGMFFSRSNDTAKIIAWAERGSVLRAVFTSVGVQSAIRRAFGPGELSKILTQLEATFNGGESRSKTPGELAAVDKALNFTTYAYLGFNPLSAAKQTTSFTVWANALPGGFKDLWRYMTHFDKSAWDHIRSSEQYKVRYGSDVGSGQDLATRGLYANPSANPMMRLMSGAGMKLLKMGDFAPGGWIAQGLYKDLLNRHMSEGMEYEAADRLALTETFNLLEETQQSGRTYNTNMLTIEHGRIGRLLTQFATSPLQQLQYETQAWREWRDMVRYKMDERRIAAARQRFIRAALINHVCLPAALNLVTAMFKAAMGDEPPWEKDGWHWTLLVEVLLGQFSRVFFVGAFAQTALEALFKRETRPRTLLPVEGVLGMGASAMITVRDLATLNVDNLRKDLERAIKSTAPTRIPYNLYRRIAGDSDSDRKRKEQASKRK